MSQKQSLIQRIISIIIAALTANVRMQVRDFQRRAVRVLSILFVGFIFFFVGLGYVVLSLARFLESSFGLLALGLVGLVFILIGIIIMMLARPRS